MKQLTLIRHAKSSWKIQDLEDSWRPLSRRGYWQLLELAAQVRKTPSGWSRRPFAATAPPMYCGDWPVCRWPGSSSMIVCMRVGATS